MLSRTSSFKAQQWRIYISLFIGWFFYYACRKTFSSTMPHLITHRGYTKKDLGIIASSFSFAYGINKFVFGIIADHVSPKRLFSSGLLLSGVCVVLFPFGYSPVLCAVLWAIEAVVQGFGWPAALKLLKVWCSPSTLGIWWSVISSSGNVAATLSPFLIAYITSVSSWDMNYYVIGGVACLLALGVFLNLDDGVVVTGSKGSTNSQSVMNFIDLFYCKELWIVSCIYFIIYCIKYTVADWGQLYFIQHLGMPEISAAASIGLVQFGGVFGNIVWGYISDRTLRLVPEKSKVSRAPALLMVCSLLTCCLYLFNTTLTKDSSQFWVSSLCFVTGFMIEGAMAIIGLASMSCVPDQLASSAHGLSCAFGQAGGFVAGWPFSYLVMSYSWTVAYQSLSVVSLLMVLANISLTLLSCQKTTPKHHAQ